MGSNWVAQIVLMGLLGAGAAYAIGNKGKARARSRISVKQIAGIIFVICILVVALIIAFAPRAPQ